MLRHKLQYGEMRAVERGVEVRTTVPRFRPAVKVEFRRDGDLSVVVDAVKNNRRVELSAAVGSGKSTKCPLLIAKATGKLVIHTIPFGISARCLAEYLMKSSDGERVTYMDDLQSDLPSHGVVIMTNVFFHARYAEDRFSGLHDAILYLDEVHESDCGTAVLREIAPALSIFSCVVQATATSDPGVTPKAHLPGARVEKTFPKTAVMTWSADDKDRPWGAASITGNVLICMDRKEARLRLSAEYREHGFDVRVCTSDTDYEYFRESMRRLADRSGSIVVVFVDYSYRSSLTIPQITTLIESGEVGVPCVANGMPDMVFRPAYDFEVQQFFGRGGRLAGENVTMWRSVEPPPKYMCDLEKLEGDAANLLFRLMGYRPPLKLADFEYFEGDVPIDIAAALRSDHPVKLCPTESRVPWVNGHVGLREEKQRNQYTYDSAVRGRSKGKTVSCHTVPDFDRPVTPPPPVPDRYAVTRVDIDGLDTYKSSRDSSPSQGTVHTLHSEMPDNLSIFDENSEFPVFTKPKRIAKHVLEARAAAAAEAEKRAHVREVDGPSVSAVITSVPDMPAFSAPSGEVVQRANTTMATRRMAAPDSDVKRLHAQLHSRANDKDLPAMSDEDLGAYVYYHGMDKAPAVSNYFMRGVQSIMHFCDSPDVRMNVRGLPDEEKLYAMKALVDMHNDSTAVAMGIQRLFAEVAKRPPDEWQAMVDPEDLTTTLEWMVGQSSEAQARVRSVRGVMRFFMRYDVDVVPPALQLEQRVMIEMMERFDRSAIKKDPDKASDYMRALNERMVKVGPGKQSRRSAIAFR